MENHYSDIFLVNVVLGEDVKNCLKIVNCWNIDLKLHVCVEFEQNNRLFLQKIIITRFCITLK